LNQQQTLALFQIKPSYAGCFKSSQALQVVSNQAKLCRLFQITPSYAGCSWLDLNQPEQLGLT
jgi:hypothetical protein